MADETNKEEKDEEVGNDIKKDVGGKWIYMNIENEERDSDKEEEEEIYEKGKEQNKNWKRANG